MPALAPEKLKTLNVGRIAKFKIASTSKETIVAANMAPIQSIFFNQFNRLFQSPNETVDSYINNLRYLPYTCEFDVPTDELIRDRLVIGAIDLSLKERLLREQKLTLDKALNLCKASETASEQLKSMSKKWKK